MASASINLSRTLADYSAPLAHDLIMVTAPTTGAVISNRFTTNDMQVSSSGESYAMEIDLVNPDINVVITAHAVMHVALPYTNDNVAEVEGIMTVAGEGDEGFQLEIVGAFKEEQQSAFFWG